MANEFLVRKGLIVSGSTRMSGSVESLNGYTGSLLGTSSHAVRTEYAASASYVSGAASVISQLFIPSFQGGINFVYKGSVSASIEKTNQGLRLSDGYSGSIGFVNPRITLETMTQGATGDDQAAALVFTHYTNEAGTASFWPQTRVSIISSTYPNVDLGSEYNTKWRNIFAWRTISGSSITASNGFYGDGSGLTNITAVSASYANSVMWNNVSLKPIGLVSSSTQVSFTTLADKPTGLVSSSAQATTWTVATASYVAWNNIGSKPNGIVSSSAQVSFTTITDKPTGLVSSSAQAVSWTVSTASYALSASWTPAAGGGGDWSSITGKPTGLVSASSQVSYTGLSNIPVGIVSSSTQASGWTVLSSSYAVTASLARSSSLAASSSYANATTWNSVNNKPVGIVSSSAQATTWTVATASFVNASNVTLGTLANARLPTQINVTGVTASFQGAMTSSGIDLEDNLLQRPHLQDYAEVVNNIGVQGSSFNINYESGNTVVVGISADVTASITNPPATGRMGAMTFIVTSSTGTNTLYIASGSFMGVANTGIVSGTARIYSVVGYTAGTKWFTTYMDEV